MKLLNKRKKITGFTLIELLFTFSILATSILGILLTYISMFILLDLSRDLTLANNAAQAKMEEIKNIDFSNLSSEAGSFDLTAYGFPSVDSRGIIEVDTDSLGYAGELTRVRILAFFRSRGRVIGEDLNLNGVLDPGEDRNLNRELDSPVEVITLIAK